MMTRLAAGGRGAGTLSDSVWSPASILASFGWLLLAGCARPAPRPIAYGQEPCAHCHMTIIDPRFAGELVTQKGRVYVFDDVECLAAFVRDAMVPATDIQSLWVNDFLHPEQRLDATRAVFQRNPGLRTPMASGIAAFAAGTEGDSVRATGAALESWAQVLAHPSGHSRGSMTTPGR
jgi:copper chaperone NosL